MWPKMMGREETGLYFMGGKNVLTFEKIRAKKAGWRV